ncbi:DNA alkylation repair protein [Putridiphycobacter roseus]|uniref:DNA alkylation repair protein n=1 Tax=Putridiphycobacter roseus TaxID=2219161 RepID=A0A2W1NR39_9FLAO|nr:DNA alkylation repair protein [Putridiphycobacter roseus]PZE17148.1 DNA alkylation repair protein [Putridiphycobacter roseus]
MITLKKIIDLFEQEQNKVASDKMSAYLKHQFKFYGIRSPTRKLITKPIITATKTYSKSEIKTLVTALWATAYRELHHLALDISVNYFKKNTAEKDLEFFIWMATKNQWWDSIDVIAPKLMGNYFLLFPEKREAFIEKCLTSNDFWLVRCAILFPLKYKESTDLDLLFETILKVPNTKEFFIHKAIGWVLRENTRLYPEAVIDFVRDHENKLSNLSKKEALRLIK